MTIAEITPFEADDDRSFDLFYAERYRPMLHVAVGIVDQPCIAEEIVQEALQRVWVRWDSLDEPSCYLRSIVVNGCYDELRKRRVRRDNAAAAGRDPGHGTEGEVDYLADALSSVAPKRRKALVLRYYGGHSLSEVAEAMDIPTGTAKSLIHRGLADLRGVLN